MSGLDDLIGSLTKSGGGGGGGIDDLLGGLLGGGQSGAGGGSAGGLDDLLGGLIGMLKSGGLQKMMSGFQEQGMGEKADSWVSSGGNEPVSGSEMRVGLGDEEVRHFAQQAGIPEDEAADVLAAVVPQVVNNLTPNGSVPSDDELEALLRQLQPAQAG